MSQTSPDASDPTQYSCQCSTMDSTRASRGHETTKISSAQPQELSLGFEALQTAFEPIRRLESSQLEMLDVQVHSSQSDISRHNSSCSPLKMDLSRQLAVQTSNKVQESSGTQDSQKTNSNGSSSDLMESGKSDVSAFTHREPSSRNKTVQNLNDRYQHYLPENCVHKHGENVRTSGILENDALVNYQRHHHGKGITHHHIPQHLHQHHHANQQPTNSLVQIAMSNPIPTSYSPTSNHRTPNNHQSATFDHYSSNPNLMKREMNSPNVNNSSLSSTPLIVSHHHNSSGPVTGHAMNHVNSGVSCESSATNARSHSRVDHVHDYHHHFHRHLQPAHVTSSNQSEKARERISSTTDHNVLHHNHLHKPQSHSHSLDTEAKCPTMGIDALQVQVPPNKASKCQCHTLKEDANKRRVDDESVGVEIDSTSRVHQPPALPPRPPPRPTQRFDTACNGSGYTGEGGCCKKYVILCCLCGTLSAAVGSLFMAVHAVLSSHTASLALFETVPSYIPGTMLILMGFFTMLLARRKHRYGLLMKMCGSIGVVCALVCVLVTVTTTVVHMSRLQSLRECVYTARAKSCTCYGVPQSKTDPGVLFEGTPHCDVVHGALYMCLRALFGVSVAGILACIFSCMLVYQLLSHEKKKMYWEQLELRCRSLYGQGQGPTNGSCGCCNDCGGTSPWWAQTPGNLYTPNPDLAPSRRWRLPWSRSRGPAPSPDSNYGFHTQTGQTEINADSTTGPYSVLNSQSVAPYPVLNPQNNHYTSGAASYSVLEAPIPLWGPPPPYSDPNSPSRRSQVPEPRPRLAKKMEHFEQVNDCDTHRSRSAIKRPSDNYENAEEISNSTDPEGGNEETLKGRRTRRSLKGVENNGFQQESNSNPKQSESELYFGDVSSCCGPESSFYDLAIEKEGIEGSEGSVDYLAAHLGKRQLSKRSRLPLPLPADSRDMPPENYTNNDEPRNEKGPFLAPDAQYEVIQQNRYASYYSTKKEDDLHGEELQSTSSYFAEEEREGRDWEYRNLQEEETTQCCLSDTTTLDSGWQSGEQQQSDDNVRPINV